MAKQWHVCTHTAATVWATLLSRDLHLVVVTHQNIIPDTQETWEGSVPILAQIAFMCFSLRSWG